MSTHLDLSHAVEADLDSLVAIWNHPDVQRFLYDRPVERDYAHAYLTQVDAEDGLGLWSIRRHGQPRIVGSAALIRVSPSTANDESRLSGLVEPVVAIDPETKKKGEHLGREVLRLLLDHAFQGMGLHQVAATVHAQNSKAISLINWFGFAPLSVVLGPIHQLHTYTLSAAAYAERSAAREDLTSA